ncbi:MAG: hypothetical protein WDN75_05295 [Bacteroidota bacterium]
MKTFCLLILFVLTFAHATFSQQAFYDVTAANGNGIRFWDGNDGFKISMGYSSEYQYGPVNSFSIRSTMDNYSSGRGWTWGLAGSTVNVAGMDVSGNLQIAFWMGK